MKRKVANGLLVVVLASNNALGSGVVVNAMVNTNNTSEITLETSENTDVITDDHSTVEADKTEETGTDVSEETNSSEITTEDSSEDGTNKTEETDKDVSEETNSSEITTEDPFAVGTNKTEETGEDESDENNSSGVTNEEVLEEDKNNIPQLESSSQIQPTTIVNVSNEAELKAELNSDNTLINLTQNIELTAPLEIAGKNTIIIDGKGKKITFKKDATNKKNIFILKNSNAIVVKDVTIEDYYSAAISVNESKNIFLEDVDLIGQAITNPDDTRSLVGVDLVGSTANIKNIKSKNHRYAGIRVRNVSTLTLDGWNEHTDDTNDIESQVISGQENNIISDKSNNYSEWEVKLNADSNTTSTIYKVKTLANIDNFEDFKKAIALDNTTITLTDDIEINEKVEIIAKKITINGASIKDADGNTRLHQIKITSNASTNDDGINTSALVVKSKNTIISNLTIINETTKPGLTLYGAEDVKLSDIEIIGIKSELDTGTDTNPDYGPDFDPGYDPDLNPDPEEDPDSDLPDTNLYSDTAPTNATSTIERSGVALDIYNSKNVKLNNIKSSNSLYRDFQIRGGSQVEILSKNAHSTGAVHIQSIQKEGEAENVITDASNFYLAGVPFEEKVDGDIKITKVDYFLKVEKDATEISDILEGIKNGGTVVTLQNDITLDWDDLPEDDTESLKIEVNRNVTIDGNGHTLDLNGLGTFVLKGKDIIVKNITIDNSFEHGVNIYNSKNVLLDNVVLSNSFQSGIFVNGSTVVLKDVSTLYNVDAGIKITRSRTLRSPSHFDSEVKVKGTLTQKESNISVTVLNLEMLDDTKQDNKFIPQEGTYTEHTNDANYKKLSQYYIDLFQIEGTDAAQKEYWEQEIDYLVLQEKINVKDHNTVLDENKQPIRLMGDGVTDDTDNLIRLIKYAASNSQELYFPAGTYKIT